MKKKSLNAKLTLNKKSITPLINPQQLHGGGYTDGFNDYNPGFGLSDASLCHSCVSECLCPIPETQFYCPPPPTNGPNAPCCPAPNTFNCK